MKAIIIDDEKHACEALKALLELYCPQVKVIASEETVETGLQKIQDLCPDLVFLDVAIGDSSGFDLLNLLDSCPFQVIFITAYSDFALKAFQVDAVDYLMKPVEPSLLIRAVNKASQSIDANKDQSDQMALLYQNLNTPSQIAISTLEGITLLDTDKILYVNGSGNYSTFYLHDQEKIVASKNLKHFESQLPNNSFFRIHQSYLINYRFIKRIISADRLIELKNGISIPFAQSRKEDLLKNMNISL